MQTKNNSDSVEPCTATNANNFSSRSYNVPNSNSSSTKNSFSCQTLIEAVVVEKSVLTIYQTLVVLVVKKVLLIMCQTLVVVAEKSRSYNLSNSSNREKSFLQSVKL